ncbi:MAG: HNH endonuclease signature motif containing protein [Nocardioidaceae bacterium]
MADTLVERVTGQTRADQVPVMVNVVMNNSTLFRADDEAGTVDANHKVWPPSRRTRPGLRRAGLSRPILPTRQNAASGVARSDGSTSGARHQPAHTDARACHRCHAGRTDADEIHGIGFDGAIRDGDHIDDHATGGPTTAGNGAGLCEHCHHLKDHPGMTTQAAGGYDVWGRRTQQAETAAAAALLRWTTPIGKSIVTQARPALGYGTNTQAQLRHRKRLRYRALSTDPDTPLVDRHNTSALEQQLARELLYAA